MLFRNKRYSLLKVFWVVLAVNLFFFLIGMIALLVSPVPTPDLSWEKLLSLKSIISKVFSISFFTGFYYFTVNQYYYLWSERKPTSDFIKPSVIAIVALISFYLINHLLFVKDLNVRINNEEINSKLTIGIMIFSYTLGSMFNLGLGMLAAYLTSLRDERKQRKVLEAQKMQLEVEKSQANFNFLKAQINPHFLHNTLNFLYAKSLPYSAELSEGILTLSEIMRYALSEGNAKDGKAPLKDEIEHVRNVIKINQLRFSNKLNVQFEVEGVINGATIIPFVLITLVENAFKHGDLKSNEHPIEIRLKVERDSLYFYCRNRKKNGPKELSTGIGLDNIKKRLDLAYGKDYALNVKDEVEMYTTELTITKL